MTSWALAPAVCGNTAARRSIASCDSVPGIANESCMVPPSASPPTTAPIAITNQATMTGIARR